MKKAKPVLCTWGYDEHGIYLDCYMEIDVNNTKQSRALKAIELRSRYQMTTMGLFHVPQKWTRKELNDVLPMLTEEKLKKARVSINDLILRLGPETSLDTLRKHRDMLPCFMGQDPELDKNIEAVLKE